jgi:ADP-ribosylglycohydrolase
MKAREFEQQTMRNCIPKILTAEEQGWDFASEMEKTGNELIKMKWESHVPGSNAEEHVIIGAIQDTENMGYDVREAEKIIPLGQEALKKGDLAALAGYSAEVFARLAEAPINPKSPRWKYRQYLTFQELEKKIAFKEYPYSLDETGDYLPKTYLGWLGQICGGALGTACEGYTKENISKAFGEIRGYIRTPNTYNDDITYELAFLKAIEEKGKKVTSRDIALKWVSLIPTGWSAEEIALENIKMGIMPPESGFYHNPYREWIGAQMRGAVCGMLAPGDPKKAAGYAYMDGVVSHASNGVLGEVFNALLTSLAYVKKGMKETLLEAISYIPDDSEYYSVLKRSLDACLKYPDWEKAWDECEKIFGIYNWIHAYPNASIEVIALYYGQGDYDETMHIIASAGYDVDCNAAQAGTAVAILNNKPLNPKWTEPIGDTLITYMRNGKELSIKGLAAYTRQMALKLK